MMTPPKTYTELEALIQNKVEEGYNLEYKSADALLQIGNKNGKKDGVSELIKDISAMANSAGGIIVYGIKEYDDPEKKHLPEKITPIKRQEFSKERIEQLIGGNIMPKVEGIRIHPIELQQPDEVAYALEIPQGHTAHQNTKDQRYYKRQNFEAVAMLDYEIKDVMNRNIHPQLTLEMDIVLEEYQTGTIPPQYNQQYFLTVRIKNHGTTYASYVNYFIEINRFFLDDVSFRNHQTSRKENSGEEFIEYYGENTIRDVVGSEYTAIGSMPKYGPSRYDPILPKMYSRKEKLKLQAKPLQHLQFNAFKESKIRWRIYADNAPEQTGEILIGDLPSFKKYIL